MPLSTFFLFDFFPFDVFSRWLLLIFDILSMSEFLHSILEYFQLTFFIFWHVVPVEVFYIVRFSQSTFFTFQRFVLVDVFLSSIFCPSRHLFHSTFCPIQCFPFNVLSIEVFYRRLFFYFDISSVNRLVAKEAPFLDFRQQRDLLTLNTYPQLFASLYP